MRKLAMLTVSAVLLGLAGAAGTPAKAAPIGNVATVPDRAVTGANPLLDKVHWRRWRHCHRHHGWRRCHGGLHRRYYGGRPSIHLRFGADRYGRHRHRDHDRRRY
jgi:hypothetical protein